MGWTRRGAAAAALAAWAAPAWALPEPARPRLRRAYFASSFGQLHARIAEPEGPGVAPPLLLFHQTPLSSRMFDQLLPLLAVNGLVIALDTPGYGESDRPAERPTLAAYGDAMLDAVKVECGESFDVLGYHTGAAIAADLAARRPEVRRAVLIAMPLFDEARRQALLTQMAEPDAPLTEEGAHLVEQWRSGWRARAPAQTDDEVARLFAEKLRPGAHAEWALRSAMEADLAAVAAAIAKPTLVIAPHDGLQGPSARAAELARARLIELPQLRYGLFDAAPAQIAALVLAHRPEAQGAPLAQRKQGPASLPAPTRARRSDGDLRITSPARPDRSAYGARGT